MKQLLNLISKSKRETPKITVYTIKTRSTVYPDKQIDINEWYKHVHSYKENKLRLG
jgi:hypothetical protein